MSLHVKLHYTHIEPSLVGMESCCSCKWVTDLALVEPSMVWVRKGWANQFDKIMSQNVSHKVLQSQCHLKHGLVPPEDCHSKEILGNINEEVVTQGQDTRAMVPACSVVPLHNRSVLMGNIYILFQETLKSLREIRQHSISSHFGGV